LICDIGRITDRTVSQASKCCLGA